MNQNEFMTFFAKFRQLEKQRAKEPQKAISIFEYFFYLAGTRKGARSRAQSLHISYIHPKFTVG